MNSVHSDVAHITCKTLVAVRAKGHRVQSCVLRVVHRGRRSRPGELLLERYVLGLVCKKIKTQMIFRRHISEAVIAG